MTKASKRVQCTKCAKTFARRYELSRHMVQHRSDKDSLKLKCPMCNHRTLQRSNLLTHMNAIHYKIKLYQCGKCPSTFSDNSSCIRHEHRAHKLVPKTKRGGEKDSGELAPGSDSSSTTTTHEEGSDAGTHTSAAPSTPTLDGTAASDTVFILDTAPTTPSSYSPTTPPGDFHVPLPPTPDPSPPTADLTNAFFPSPDLTLSHANGMQSLLLDVHHAGYIPTTSDHPIDAIPMPQHPHFQYMQPIPTHSWILWNQYDYNQVDFLSSPSSTASSSVDLPGTPGFHMPASNLRGSLMQDPFVYHPATTPIPGFANTYSPYASQSDQRALFA